MLNAERSRDPAEDLLGVRLHEIFEQGKLPLLSMDMDDTLLPFGKVIGEAELDLLIAYAGAGGQLAFNTLAPKEWFYLRVIDPLVNASHKKNCARLLTRLHWIVSGGREIFVYDFPNRSYRRISSSPTGSKAAALLYLLHYLDDHVALLAFYGDRFDDPENDGSALEVYDIPLVVNVGYGQLVPQSDTGQLVVNADEKGPVTTQRHLAFVAAVLRNRSRRVLPAGDSVLPPECTSTEAMWRFENSTDVKKPRRVEVRGPGFVWSWSDQAISYLTALVQVAADTISRIYAACLPDGIAGFTFFWTGGLDTAGGQTAGHWEGQDFCV